MAAKTPLEKLFDLSGRFIVAQKGDWNHSDWERFLEGIAGLGVTGDSITDEDKRNLGNMLEAGKHFYNRSPAATKRPAARKRAPRTAARPES